MQSEWNFDYTGAEQNVTLKPGKYKLECWGACGGGWFSEWTKGAKGGYSKAELTLKKETILYVYAGETGCQKFENSINNWTGFNGGGRGTNAGADPKFILCGGGATDIRLIRGSWSNEQGLLSRILVAGGAGAISSSDYGVGNGGGMEGSKGFDGSNAFVTGGTQYQGGIGLEDKYNGSFGRASSTGTGQGGGGGWFGGAGGLNYNAAGGSGYALTKDSYKPPGYIPTSKYYLDNVVMTTGGNTTKADGYAKITLLQALPFLTVSSYNSTTATFKADHTDPTLLTKIEWFIDEKLKETITSKLTIEKTINYTLEDNALHTIKIVVTDSSNATAERIFTVSKGIAPLPTGSSSEEVTNKWREIKDSFKTGKTSIINTLALKNIESNLNNTLVELSEKIKTSFDSSDASVQDLMNQLTQANNTISQLNSKYKYASGTIDVVKNSSLMANLYGESFGRQPGTWLKIDNLGFIPNIFVAECQYVTSNNYFFKHIVIATCNINWLWEKKDFSARIVFTKEKNSNQDFSGSGIIYSNNERDVYINNKGINVPASSPNVSSYLHSWHAIKFI
ncbi:Glycine rich protein [Clostridioides difficile]|uniref:glycine rich domain-containing protein n=3 Tax=Clostridioides difficile TaxID=1496 RepID=UPI00097FFC0E|nr:glycine rich domain-containing protein [Clostridioides difficile]SJN63255.1 Glycine rich protein [Clostridioides difficile]